MTVYRIFRRVGEATPVRAVVIAMIVLAGAVTAVGVTRVARQHEVLRLGYELSRESDHVRLLREARHRLELERATLAAPDRIRRLATALGMTPVAPDRIRVVERHHKVAERKVQLSWTAQQREALRSSVDRNTPSGEALRRVVP